MPVDQLTPEAAYQAPDLPKRKQSPFPKPHTALLYAWQNMKQHFPTILNVLNVLNGV